MNEYNVLVWGYFDSLQPYKSRNTLLSLFRHNYRTQVLKYFMKELSPTWRKLCRSSMRHRRNGHVLWESPAKEWWAKNKTQPYFTWWQTAHSAMFWPWRPEEVSKSIICVLWSPATALKQMELQNLITKLDNYKLCSFWSEGKAPRSNTSFRIYDSPLGSHVSQFYDFFFFFFLMFFHLYVFSLKKGI